MTEIPSRFEDIPLLTPEHIQADPRAAFAVVPLWIHLLHWPDPEDSDEPVAVVVVGRKHPAPIVLSLHGLALLCELSRLPGISVVTNSDGKGRLYLRVTIAGAEEDLTQVTRLFYGAGPYVQVKVDGIKSDMRPENLRAETASRVGKETRDVILRHAERISREWEARGTMPSHITAASYMANLRRLLEEIDREASGDSTQEGR